MANADRINVGNVERLFSAVLGALILLVVRRKVLVYGAATVAAAYLLYRGVSGRCRFYEEAGIDTSGYDFATLGFDKFDVAASEQRKAAHRTSASSQGSPIADHDLRDQIEDDVDEAAYESFPASDPPSTW